MADESYDDSAKVRMCVSSDAMPIEKIKNAKHIGLTSDFIGQIAKVSGFSSAESLRG